MSSNPKKERSTKSACRLTFGLFALFLFGAPAWAETSLPLAAAHLRLAQASLQRALDDLGTPTPSRAVYELDAVRLEIGAAGESLRDAKDLETVRSLRAATLEAVDELGRSQARAPARLRELDRRLDAFRRDLSGRLE